MPTKRSIPSPARASTRGRDRLKMVALVIAIPILVFFALTRVYRAYAPAQEPIKDPAADTIVEVSRGTTLVEAPGTPGREIADWLAAHPNGTRLFEVGGHQFNGDTANLTEESVGRLSRLAVMLKAVRDARVAITGYSSPEASEQAAQAMSEQRAERVRAELIRFGIAPARITATGRGAAASAGSGQQDQRVTISISRDPAL